MSAMEDEYPSLVLPAMEVASEIAAMTFDSAGDSDIAETIELPPVDALRISVRWAITTGDKYTGLKLLQGSTHKRIFSAARDTLVLNADKEEGTRFARVARPGACDFCLMLQTRGAVYHSKDLAGAQTHYHDDCSCRIVVARAGTPFEELDVPDLTPKPTVIDVKPPPLIHQRLEARAKEIAEEAWSTHSLPSGVEPPKRDGGWSIQDARLGANGGYVRDRQDYQFTVNCQRVAPTYELRRRGYDVEALPRDKVGMTRVDIANLFKDENGNIPKWSGDGVGSPRKLLTQLRGMPEGARGFMCMEWKAGSAHVTNWEKRDGKLWFIECQIDQDVDLEDYGENFRRAKRVLGDMDFDKPLTGSYLRTDTLTPDWRMMQIKQVYTERRPE